MAAVVRRLDPAEWRLLRQVRLRALEDAPYAFGSSFGDELRRPDEWWATSVRTLAWFVAADGSRSVGLAAGWAPDRDSTSRHLISMWVGVDRRGDGTADALLTAVLRWASGDGAASVILGVSEGNDRARRFYERHGFVATGDREPLRSNPAVCTMAMRLDLRTGTLRPAGYGQPRMRFAPSPAGDLHVGHVRTAVLTWVLARQLGGSYFVRFENTDGAKERAGSRAAIVGDLEWLGLVGPEPPHDQAEMTDSHRAALSRLSKTGCTYADDGAVRFRLPRGGNAQWDDLARGPMSVDDDDLADPVLVRASGEPTFFLASTVDDIEDGITHVLRAAPMARATAVQLSLWRGLGVEPPRVGHIPLVTGPGNAPLRFGAAGGASVKALRDAGIGATALVLYLAMPQVASWKQPPTGLDEIVQRVDVRRLPRRPTTFDGRALELLNGRYNQLAR